jgi:hypothetical protein
MNANLFADHLKNMFRSDIDELWTDGPSMRPTTGAGDIDERAFVALCRLRQSNGRSQPR